MKTIKLSTCQMPSHPYEQTDGNADEYRLAAVQRKELIPKAKRWEHIRYLLDCISTFVVASLKRIK